MDYTLLEKLRDALDELDLDAHGIPSDDWYIETEAEDADETPDGGLELVVRLRKQ